jgi:hypothetical protein
MLGALPKFSGTLKTPGHVARTDLGKGLNGGEMLDSYRYRPQFPAGRQRAWWGGLSNIQGSDDAGRQPLPLVHFK